MTSQDAIPEETAAKAVVASGFPFQTAIAGVIRAAHGWRVMREEFPWLDRAGDDQFLDIVATSQRYVVTVECKKTQKETLTFLQVDDDGERVNRARCVYLSQVHDSTLRMEHFTGEWQLIPNSTESMFCVVSTSHTGKDQRLLERDARLLVGGTDAYARHFKLTYQRKGDNEPDQPVIPAIVTNAELFVAKYAPSDVSLASGQLPVVLPTPLRSVPWVRFRKPFGGSKDLSDRTVFVVRATELSKWLSKLQAASAEVTDKAAFK